MTEHITLSLAEVFQLRGQAFDSIKAHTAAVNNIAVALEDLDMTLQENIDERSIDNQNSLVFAQLRLAQLLDCEVRA